MSEEKKVLLEVKNLKKYFTVETDFWKAQGGPEGGGRRIL